MAVVSSCHFDAGGVRFLTSPTVTTIGFDGPGPVTAAGAVRCIQASGLKHLNVLDLCCGVGVIGVLMAKALGPDIIRSVTFSDINVFNIEYARVNVAANIKDRPTRCAVSDGLSGLHDRYDLIVSNPPHNPVRPARYEVGGLDGPTASAVGGYDPDWQLHRHVWRDCREYLSPNCGKIWILENGLHADGALAAWETVKTESHLVYMGRDVDTTDSAYCWLRWAI